MQAPHVSTPIAGHNGTIFVSIELSQKNWFVTLHSPDKDRMSRYKVVAGDASGLLSLLERVRERARRALGAAPGVTSCYEAGYDGYWLHRFLQANGIENYVFDPASIAVEQRGRRAKTDRIDGEQLVRTLRAHCRGEPRVVRIVRVPSIEQEDARRATRERDRLVKEQTQHTNRLKSLLRLLGLKPGNPRRRDWLTWLGQQRDWQGRPVPPHMLAEVERQHARLTLLRGQLSQLEKSQAEVEPTPELVETARRQETLLRLKSLGPAFTGTLTYEVFYKDFRNQRQVGSYVGLAPSPWKSGGIDREQGISKAGNPRARQKAIELAWLWVRHQPDSALTLWFLERIAKANKRNKRIAIVALARKLIIALWRFVITGLVPTGAKLKPVKA